MTTTPTNNQIFNCKLMGWEYMGDGLFCKDNLIGYFTEEGWVKE